MCRVKKMPFVSAIEPLFLAPEAQPLYKQPLYNVNSSVLCNCQSAQLFAVHQHGAVPPFLACQLSCNLFDCYSGYSLY